MKRAPQRGAFFVALLFFLAGIPAANAQHPLDANACRAEKVDEQATVKQVVDGDTLRLADDRLVRFIGVNTPEIGRDGKTDEAYATEAKQTLEGLLGPAMRVQLRYGVEPQDRYHRLLAHVYLTDGRSVEATLLQAGMAAHIVVPPNVWNSDCYRSAENSARQTRLGVWSALYRPIKVEALPRTAAGFRLIAGRIERIGESRKSIWLNFTGRPGDGPREGVALRVARTDLMYFKTWQPQQLQDREIEVRGWLVPQKQQLVMQLRHPAAVTIIDHSMR